MKKLLAMLAVIIFLSGIAGQCYAASNEAINPEAEPVTVYGKVGSGGISLMRAGADKIESVEGEYLYRASSCRVLSVGLFNPGNSDIIGIYNTDGDYDIRDLEFEFDIGISSNNGIKTKEVLDFKGATFERGLGILARTPGIRSTAIYDY